MNLSDDSFAIILLCTSLTNKDIDANFRPYTIAQWNKLTELLIKNKYTPKDLFNLSDDIFIDVLQLTKNDIARIKFLLSRSGQLSLALYNLGLKGIKIVTRADIKYPRIYKSKLKKYAPPVLYYCGDLSLYDKEGISIVGSRNIDENSLTFTQKLAQKLVNEGYTIVSGGARGVDYTAESSTLKYDGKMIVVMADSMSKKITDKNTRNAIIQGNCLIVSPFHPDEHFKNYNAMDRNKYIYAASKYSIVVSADYKKGGTWTGAIENYKKQWSKIGVRYTDINMPLGNEKLLELNNVIKIDEKLLDNSNFKINSIFENQNYTVTYSNQLKIFN